MLPKSGCHFSTLLKPPDTTPQQVIIRMGRTSQFWQPDWNAVAIAAHVNRTPVCLLTIVLML